jgi:FkbM family methyltransferase
MKNISIQLNKIKLLFDYLLFKIKYPKTKFVRVNKTIGTYYSQDGQDIYLSSLLFKIISNDKRINMIIDIGANHPIRYSNSLFFEKYLQFNVIAIDPLIEFENLWKELRPNSEFINVALGECDDVLEIKIPVGGDNMFSSLDVENVKSVYKGGFEYRNVEVVSLKSILERRNINEVLFISIDVEGFELEVLKGIDFDKVQIIAFVIENNTKQSFGDDRIRNFLISKGYIYYARIGWLDDVFILKTFI